MKPLIYWNPDGFEISSYKFSLRDRINQIYKTSGSDNTGMCTYTYNELGFRGESIYKNGFRVMSLGCSITEGVGVNDDETWPAQFCSNINNSVNLNFGTGGRSNDFICRCLLSYYDLIKPDLVLIMYTFTHRREIYTKNNFIEPYIPTNVWGRLLETEEGMEIQRNMNTAQNENQDFINWYKNHLIIKNFLENKKCNWLWDSKNIYSNYSEYNEYNFDKTNIDYSVDSKHPGPLSHKKYSNHLYDHIIKNFPNFIPI